MAKSIFINIYKITIYFLLIKTKQSIIGIYQLMRPPLICDIRFD